MSAVNRQQLWTLLSTSTGGVGKQARDARMQVLREDANGRVKEELRHIPRGEESSLQNYLRFFYNALRRHHLAKTDKGKEDTLKEAIQSLRKISPDFRPEYDKEFFETDE